LKWWLQTDRPATPAAHGSNGMGLVARTQSFSQLAAYTSLGGWLGQLNSERWPDRNLGPWLTAFSTARRCATRGISSWAQSNPSRPMLDDLATHPGVTSANGLV